MKVFSTRRVLTHGVRLVEGGQATDSRYFWENDQIITRPKDWHTDLESALERANEVRAKKIASLEKQISKIESAAKAEREAWLKDPLRNPGALP